MQSDGLKKNMFFQFAYQILVLVVPLIMAPYLTRTLGETAIGVYSYTYSIAYYFVLLSMLGIAKHGQRIIAERRNNECYLRKTFWSLFSLHIIISAISFVLYIAFIIKYGGDKTSVYWAQGLYVLSALFDITWLFYGLEIFKPVVLRNAIIKVIELLLTLLCVHNSSDVLVYTVIMSASVLCSFLSLLPTAIKYVKPIKIKWHDIREHIKPLLVLSVSVLAISLYTMFDKTLLGIMTSVENVAYYEYSNKIINIPKTLIVVVGTVLFPRACACIANNDYSGIKRYYRYSLLVVYFIGFASIFGLFSISDLFVEIYYGSNFISCGEIIKVMSPIVLIIGLGDIFRMQFLIPMKKDIQYTICVIMNAVINLVVSFLLIPRIGIYGAVFGTLCAEIFGLLFQGVLVKQYINIRETIYSSVPFIVSGVVMSYVIYAIKIYYNQTLVHLAFQIVFGGLAYCISLMVYFCFMSSERNEYKRLIRKMIRRT